MALGNQELSQSSHEQSIRDGERFKFGENWQQFLQLLNDERIAAAETSLKVFSELGISLESA